MDAITPAQAAEILGVTAHQVRWLIRAGKLRARRYGVSWLIRPADLDRIERGQPGRPKAQTA